ncbi:unnamed protein product [Spirodela intermedia]|uniref:EF-hand domain-containing protein n=1 Tax=Spirodela intermedia TaxID=51605 RepID=A0A7I8IAK1_SPIIN|nr:unnamed protein product [Spirodela intermedia]CAA6654568.1 unnamed protein product [Spirodela intermedia]
MGGTEEESSQPALDRPSQSFQLRSSSINSLRLRRVFDLFDCDGDGKITTAELGQVLCRLGMEAEAEELKTTMQAFVKPGHNSLQFDDFKCFDGSLGAFAFGGLGDEEAVDPSAEESDLTEAFRVFDEDGDGFISAKELQSMICSVDTNRDGRVDFHEFKHMMHNISARSS